MRRPALSMFILLLIFLTFSCDRGMVYDEYRHIEGEGWSWDEPVRFDVELADTTGEYNILIHLRHTTEYPMSNLYMFLDLSGPSGQTLRDTIQFILAEPDGRWIGSGNGKLREISFLYRERTRFPETGSYHFSLEQAMRVKTLPVNDIGLRIEKYIP